MPFPCTLYVVGRMRGPSDWAFGGFHLGRCPDRLLHRPIIQHCVGRLQLPCVPSTCAGYCTGQSSSTAWGGCSCLVCPAPVQATAQANPPALRGEAPVALCAQHLCRLLHRPILQHCVGRPQLPCVPSTCAGCCTGQSSSRQLPRVPSTFALSLSLPLKN